MGKDSTITDSCKRMIKAHGLNYVRDHLEQGYFGIGTVEARRCVRGETVRQKWPEWLGFASTAVAIVVGIAGLVR